MPQAPTLNAPASATLPSGNQPASTNAFEQTSRSTDTSLQSYRVDVVGPHLGTRNTNQFPSSTETTTVPSGSSIAVRLEQGVPMMGIPWEQQDNQPEELSTATFNLAPSDKMPMGGIWLPATALRVVWQELGMRLASILAKDLMERYIQPPQVNGIDFDRVQMPPRSRRTAVMAARYMGKGEPRPFQDIFLEE